MQATRKNFLLYNKVLRPYALKNRNSMTKAEACLWKHALRARKINGQRFSRQRPVMSYISDFMCKKLKLIIEVDGITHQFEPVIKNDIIRQKNLEAAGFTVIRFTDDEVLGEIGEVIEKIILVVEGLEKTTPLPPAGGGQSREAIRCAH